jgi:hypothetical protein
VRAGEHDDKEERVWKFDFTTILVLLVVAVLLLIVTFELWIPHP